MVDEIPLKNKESIYIHLGQAGCQIGSALWELYCCEHGVRPDGRVLEGCDLDDNKFLSHFQHTRANFYVPRCIFADTEDMVVDEIRRGPYKDLFNDGDVINTKLDSGGVYILKNNEFDIYTMLEERIRRLMEQCDHLQSIFYVHALGGGSGSSIAAYQIDKVKENMPKLCQNSYSIFPFRHRSTGALEPFNAAQFLSQTFGKGVMTFMLDNEALFNLCKKHLDSPTPSFPQINRIIAQILSAGSASYRFKSSLNCDIEAIQGSLMPFPAMCYPTLVYAPLLSARRATHESLSLHQINRCLFSKEYFTVSYPDPEKGKYMNAIILYRGYTNLREVAASIKKLLPYTSIHKHGHARLRKEGVTQKMRFVKWVKGGLRFGYTQPPPVAIPGSGIAQTDNAALLMGQYSGVVSLFDYLRNYLGFISGQTILYWTACCDAGYDQSQAFETPADKLFKIIRIYKDVDSETAAKEGDDTPDEDEVERMGRWQSPLPYGPTPIVKGSDSRSTFNRDADTAGTMSAAGESYAGGDEDVPIGEGDDEPFEDAGSDGDDENVSNFFNGRNETDFEEAIADSSLKLDYEDGRPCSLDEIPRQRQQNNMAALDDIYTGSQRERRRRDGTYQDLSALERRGAAERAAARARGGGQGGSAAYESSSRYERYEGAYASNNNTHKAHSGGSITPRSVNPNASAASDFIRQTVLTPLPSMTSTASMDEERHTPSKKKSFLKSFGKKT